MLLLISLGLLFSFKVEGAAERTTPRSPLFEFFESGIDGLFIEVYGEDHLSGLKV